MVTHTPTVTNIEDRARSAGLNLSQLARRADVSARRIWESRLADADLRRIEAVLDEVGRQSGEVR
jgi:hypothetical protein